MLKEWRVKLPNPRKKKKKKKKKKDFFFFYHIWKLDNNEGQQKQGNKTNKLKDKETKTDNHPPPLSNRSPRRFDM